jgi:hypothetical protein
VERCHGKTKSGDRCKRSARAGSRFCATHGGQAEEALGRSDSSGETSQQRDPLNTLIGLAVLSAVVCAALTFRRLFRFLEPRGVSSLAGHG